MGANGRPLRTTRKITNLTERPGWYRIKAQAAGPTRVDIYDEIGFMAVTAQEFINDLGGINGDIEMHLNSPGGDAFDGIAIYNNLRQRSGRVAVIVDGLAASAASFIAQAASPGALAMAPSSQLMIHDGFGMAIGNAADMRDMATLLDKLSDSIAAVYARRAGKSADYWRAKMREETWYTDTEAVADGLADHILGEERPQDSWDLASVYVNVPVAVNADGNHAPMTGTHAHAHSDMDGGSHAHTHAHDGEASHAPHVTPWDPDGDGDDDTHASTDTDHDHWDADGNPVKRDGDGASMHSHVHVQNAWDGQAAMSKCHSAADFRSVCAGEKTVGDPDTQAHWALPHHDSPGGPANPDGVSAALGALNGARGGVKGLKNEAAARSHLEAHQSSSSDLSTEDIWMDALAALEGSGT